MLGMTNDPLETAIEFIGLGVLAKALGVSGQAIRKGQRRRRMPRTEWTGETNYSATIAEMSGDRVTRAALLDKWPSLVVDDEGGCRADPTVTASA